jgi:hypothetical protein
LKALLVQLVDGRFVTSICPDTEHLVAFMEARGYRQEGVSPRSRVVREVLQGKPTFKGLAGPCWGGEDTPLRYETWPVYERVST